MVRINAYANEHKKTNMKLLMLCAAMSQNQHLLNLDIMNMAMATTKKDQKKLNSRKEKNNDRTHTIAVACALWINVENQMNTTPEKNDQIYREKKNKNGLATC